MARESRERWPKCWGPSAPEEAWKELLGPDFGLAQPWLLCHLGSEQADELSNSNIQIVKAKLFDKIVFTVLSL